jgi:hypothetical protein
MIPEGMKVSQYLASLAAVAVTDLDPRLESREYEIECAIGLAIERGLREIPAQRTPAVIDPLAKRRAVIRANRSKAMRLSYQRRKARQ